MILFYKQEEGKHAATKLILNSTFSNQVHFADSISGKEEVIVVESGDHALEASQQKPTARVVMLIESEYDFLPNEILDLSRKGVSRTAVRRHVEDVVAQITTAYHEKKNLNFYVRQEEPIISRINDGKVSLEGMVNNFIVGNSTPVIESLNLIRRYCRFKEDILVRGEDGTGKEVIVKTLLDNYGYPKDKIGIINLGEISPQIFAGELFGYVKGAYTGADQTTKGMLATYEGGVIYLDEIGDLPSQAQAMFLRVLQNRQYRQVGGTTNIDFDVQFIMATNRPLEKMIQEEERDRPFRKDLFHRMNRSVITAPPLRACREDIPLLVNHFLSERNLKYPAEQKGITAQAVELLANLDWPGNRRELQHFISRAQATEPTDKITLQTVWGLAQQSGMNSYTPAVANHEKIHQLADQFHLDISRTPATQQASSSYEISQSLTL